MDTHDAKADDAIAFAKESQVAIQAFVSHLKRTEAGVLVDDKLLTNRGAKLANEGHSSGLATKMDLFGLDSQNSLSPGPATLSVANHLNFVNDSDIQSLVQWHHLHSAALHVTGQRVVRAPLLLASDECAALAFGIKAGVDLMGQ